METISIRGFYDQVVGPLDHLWVPYDRPVGLAHITAEQDRDLMPLLLQPELDERRAQDMACIMELQSHPRRQSGRLLVPHWFEQRESVPRILLRV